MTEVQTLKSGNEAFPHPKTDKTIFTNIKAEANVLLWIFELYKYWVNYRKSEKTGNDMPHTGKNITVAV